MNRTLNWHRPKACAFLTFNIILFYTFCAILGCWRWLQVKIWFFRHREVGFSYTFPYWSWKYENCHNFRLNDANDFIFTPQHKIMKINIFWSFGENPTSWRHFTARDVIFVLSTHKLLKNCWRKHNCALMGQPNPIFWMPPHKGFHLRGQPLSYNVWLKSYGFLSERPDIS